MTALKCRRNFKKKGFPLQRSMIVKGLIKKLGQKLGKKDLKSQILVFVLTFSNISHVSCPNIVIIRDHKYY